MLLHVSVLTCRQTDEWNDCLFWIYFSYLVVCTCCLLIFTMPYEHTLDRSIANRFKLIVSLFLLARLSLLVLCFWANNLFFSSVQRKCAIRIFSFRVQVGGSCVGFRFVVSLALWFAFEDFSV